MLQHEQLFDFLRLLAVVGKIVVVTTEIRLLEAFPERNLHRDRTGRIGLKRQHGEIHQGTYVVVHRLAVEVLDLVIRLRLGAIGPVGATFDSLLHFAHGGEILVHFRPVGGVEPLLHGLSLTEHRIENTAVLGEHLLLRLLVFIDLKEQVKNLVGRIDLFNWQAVLIPRDLGKVQILSCLEDQRLETRVSTNQIGDGLVNR